MKYLRLRHNGAEHLGRINGDAVELLDGDLFANPVPTGETVQLDGIEWLMPCLPPKMVIIVHNIRAAVEKAGHPIPEDPLYLVRSPQALNWHQQPIPKPAGFGMGCWCQFSACGERTR